LPDARSRVVDPELYPFSGRFLDRKGLRLHYLDEGSGASVVMVHGNPTWSFFYRNIVLDLRKDYRTIVPDHMGCGLSDKPDDSEYRYTLESRVDDLTALLEDVVPEGEIILVLHDWGGMIGSAWAVRHPERVKAVVAMNTAAFRLPDDKRFPWALRLGRNSRIGAFLNRYLNLFCRAAVRVAVKRQPLSKKVAQGYLAPYDSPAHRTAVVRFVQDIPLGPGDPGWEILLEVEDGLAGLADKPWLFLWGLQDFVFDKPFLDEWLRRFPAAKSHAFEDCGHYILEDASQEVITEIRSFADGLSSHS
jgi:pimeloyl-ACP methyl ester carboxylesterase